MYICIYVYNEMYIIAVRYIHIVRSIGGQFKRK